MGVSLHRIKDIRLFYGEDPFGTSPIDFDNPRQKPKPHGHAIAARITSENPDEVNFRLDTHRSHDFSCARVFVLQGFKPSSGTVQELNFRSRQNVWGYFSIGSVGGLHEFADLQFGHIFSYGENREDARECVISIMFVSFLFAPFFLEIWS